jgi:hypothetical protein
MTEKAEKEKNRAQTLKRSVTEQLHQDCIAREDKY